MSDRTSLLFALVAAKDDFRPSPLAVLSNIWTQELESRPPGCRHATFGSGGWSSFSQVGTAPLQFQGAPGATSTGLGKLDVLVRGTDNQAYQVHFS